MAKKLRILSYLLAGIAGALAVHIAHSMWAIIPVVIGEIAVAISSFAILVMED